MEDVKKKCVLCGSEFIATDDNKPNHQICCRCSQQLTRHINPKISKGLLCGLQKSMNFAAIFRTWE